MDEIQPATDEMVAEVAEWVATPGNLLSADTGQRLIARIRQEQARAESAEAEVARLTAYIEAVHNATPVGTMASAMCIKALCGDPASDLLAEAD